MRNPWFRTFPLLGLVLALATLSGCGKGKGEITGEVIYRNRPLPSGTITFYVTDKPGVKVFSEIKDGKYSISGCPVGAVKVTVETFWRSGQGDPRQAPKDTLKDFASRFEDTEKPGVFVPIPRRYASPDTTDLTYEVEKGPQSKDFKLEDK
jgi:hypothetical protein